MHWTILLFLINLYFVYDQAPTFPTVPTLQQITNKKDEILKVGFRLFVTPVGIEPTTH